MTNETEAILEFQKARIEELERQIKDFRKIFWCIINSNGGQLLIKKTSLLLVDNNCSIQSFEDIQTGDIIYKSLSE